MQLLVNEPDVIYGSESTTSPVIQGAMLTSSDSSIYLTRPAMFSPVVSSLLQKLERISKLKNNWNSYNADPPSDTAIVAARDFIVNNHYLDLPFYFISPGVNGEVMLEFSKDNRAAELYFNPDGSTELILFLDNKVKHESTLDEGFRKLTDFFNV